MAQSCFSFEEPLSRSHFLATWSVLLKNYAGSSEVVFTAREAPTSIGPFKVTGIKTLAVSESEQLPLPETLYHETTYPPGHAPEDTPSSLQTELWLVGTGTYAMPITNDRHAAEVEPILPGDLNKIIIKCTITDQGKSVHVSTSTGSLSSKQVSRLLLQFGHVLRQVHGLTPGPTGEKKKTNQIETASPADLRDIWTWNAAVPERVEKSVLEVFQASMRWNPEAVAVDAWDGHLSYRELDDYSSRLSSLLIKTGVRKGMIVPLCFEKTVWVPVAILAVLKSGAAFSLLDEDLPQDRLKEQCDIMTRQDVGGIILSSPSQLHRARNLGLRLLVVDSSIGDEPKVSDYTSECHPSPSDLLYVVFTSGSTGVPKAVQINHYNISTAVSVQAPVYGISPQSRVLDLASYAFDVSMGNILLSLLTGACLCIPSSWECRNDIAKTITQYRASYTEMTPSLSTSVSPSEVPTLKVLNFGGEKIYETHIARWVGTGIRLLNTYGPAECTVTSVVHADILTAPKFSVIGKGCGAVCWVTDPNNGNRLCPIGGIGELVIEGPLVGGGYLGYEKTTAAAFIESPDWLVAGYPGVAAGRKGRLYRTGDLVRYLDDGSLDYIGRRDDGQVKVRGQRLELGELAANLGRHLEVSVQCHADVVRLKNGAEHLAVFIVWPEGRYHSFRDVVIGLDSKLRASLPRSMFPTTYISVQEIPLTLSGKTNRQKLREIASGSTPFHSLMVDPETGNISATVPTLPENGVNYGHPTTNDTSTDIESKLKILWSEILNVDMTTIHRSSSFFGLGGESLAAIRLVSAAVRAGIQLNVATILQYPLLQDQAQHCRIVPWLVTPPPEPFSLLTNKDNHREIVQALARACNTVPENVEDAYPCTPLQQGIIMTGFHDTSAYVGRQVLPLPRGIDPRRLLGAWERVASAHPILRTRIVERSGRSGEMLQVVLRDGGLYDDSDEGRSKQPTMGLGTSLCRWQVTTDAGGQKSFVLTLHHAIYDGWTLPRIGAAVLKAYSGMRLETNLGFNLFIKHVTSLPAQKSLEFWAHKLADPDSSSVFPVLPPSIPEASADSILTESFPVPENYNSDISLPMLIRAAWALLASKFSGVDDVTFGSTVSGRNVSIPGIEDMLSPTITTIPVRVRLDRGHTVAEYVKMVHDEALESMPYENFGLQNIRSISSKTREGSKFETLLIVHPPDLQLEEVPKESPPDRELRGLLQGIDVSKTLSNFNDYGLMLLVSRQKDHLVLEASYDSRVLDELQVRRLFDQFVFIILQIGRQENLPVSLKDLDCVNDGDLDKIWSWNAVEVNGVEECLHHAVASTTRSQPHAEAICAWDGSVTYLELDILSTRLAKLLARKGIGKGTIVPILMEKSMWSPVAMLGIMKAGAAFVLVCVRNQPKQRLRDTIAQVGARFVVTTGAATDLACELAGEAVICDAHSLAPAEGGGDDEEEIPPVNCSPEETAFLVFTSGSTGVPKGIIMTHANFRTAVHHLEGPLGMSRESRVYDFASYSFDVAVHNALMTLILGGCVCVPSEHDRENDIEGSFERLRANWADITPSIARLMDPVAVPSLKTLILAGEALSKDLVLQWAPRVKLGNAYGPAECLICTVQSDVTDPDMAATVGKQVGCSVWILDPEGEGLVPFGAIGELAVEGPIVSPGYINASPSTQAAWRRNPEFLLRGSPRIPGSGREGLIYRTGDLVRYNPDGSIMYMGRATTQVKINGQRVELAEVEFHIRRCCTAMTSLEGPKDVVVDLVDFDGSKRLCAFLVYGTDQSGDEPAIGTRELDPKLVVPPEGLEAGLRDGLPSYMIPSLFIQISHVCLTPTLKVDRKRLKKCASEISRNELLRLYQHREALGQQLDSNHQLMQRLWAQVIGLELPQISRTSDFFQIGGNSILAIRLVKLGRKHGLGFTVTDVFRRSTLEDLADVSTATANSGGRGIDGGDASQHRALNKITPFGLCSKASRASLIKQATTTCGADESDVLDIYPCTPIQEGLFALTANNPAAYVQQIELTIAASHDVDRVLAAWCQVIKATSILRTRLVQPEQGGIQQVILRQEGIQWQWYDSVASYLAQVAQIPMALGRPLMRFGLIGADKGRDASEKWSMMWTVHHALYDPWTMEEVLRLVSLSYHGGAPTLGPEYNLFVRFVRDQHAESAVWWRSALEGAAEAAVFPRAPKRVADKAEKSIRARELVVPATLPPGCTLATLLRCVWAVLATRLTGSDAAVFGEVHLGRSAPIEGIERMCGPTTATVPILARAPRDQSVGDFVNTARDDSLAVLTHEHFGLQNIARLSSDARAACDFQTLLVLQSSLGVRTGVKGSVGVGEAESGNIFELGYSNEDMRNFSSYALLIVFQQRNSQELLAEAVYSKSVLSADMVDFLLGETQSVMDRLCAMHPDMPLRDLDLAGADHVERIWEWNASPPDTTDRFVHDLISEQAAKTPEAFAVLAHDGQLTYRQLDLYSSHLASRLVTLGVGVGDFVPLCLEKSVWVPVAMLAVLKTGAAFSLMDVSHPELRLHYVASILGARVILTSLLQEQLAIRLAAKAVVVNHTSCSDFQISRSPSSHKQSKLRTQSHQDVQNDDTERVMYVAFTSGSSGDMPKGVVVSHRNLASAAVSQVPALGFRPGSRVFDFSSYSFDATIWHTYWALTTGGCLCTPSEEDRLGNLTETITSFGSDIFFLTPSLARTINPAEVPTVKKIFLGGEAVTPIDVAIWKDHVDLAGAYGPTEVTPLCLFTSLRDPQKASNIGRGIGVNAWVVNPQDHNELMAIGAAGELVVEGPLVTQGYYRDPERTAAAFITDPEFLLRGAFTKGQLGRTGKLYKTGDLVRYAHDGTIEYIGRADTQVKLRGQRIDFGEIEYMLKMALPQAAAVVCEIIQPRSGRQMLVAFYMLAGHGGLSPPDFAAVRRILEDKLPQYMIPEAFLLVEDIPKSAAGKTERRELRLMGPKLLLQSQAAVKEKDPGNTRRLDVPLTDMETLLQGLWTTALGLEDRSAVRQESSFLKLGGDSITAMTVSALARKQGVELTTKTIQQYPELSAMALHASPISEARGLHAPFSLLEPCRVDSILTTAASICSVPEEAVHDIYPCTPLQTELFLSTMKSPGSYMRRSVFEVPENVDFKRLIRAWNVVIELNDILRTCIVNLPEHTVPLQVVLKRHEWTTHDNLDIFLAETTRQGSELGGPLSQWATIKEQPLKIVWTAHHAIYDGWSIALIEEQLRKAYAGQRLLKPPSFNTFVGHLVSRDINTARDFWRQKLEGAASSVTIYPPLPSKTYEPRPVRSMRRTLSVPRRENKDLQSLIHTSWALTVSRLTGGGDVVFGATLNGRNAPIDGIEGMVGPVITTLPVRIRIPSPGTSGTISQLFDNVRHDMSDTLPFQHALGTREIGKITDDALTACSFQTLVDISMPENVEDDQEGAATNRDNTAIRTATYDVVASDNSAPFYTFALVLFFSPTKDGNAIKFEAEYDPNVLSTREVERLSERLERVLSQLAGLPATSQLQITDIDCVGRADLDDIWAWNKTIPPAVNRCLHHEILDSARRWSPKTAIDAWDCKLTYEDLAQLSQSLASKLRKHGIGRGSLVPMLVEKSGYVSVAALAVLRTGAAFMPLDSQLPAGRINAILSQMVAPPQVILACTATTAAARDLISGNDNIPIIMIDQSIISSESPIKDPFSTFGDDTQPDDDSCILFTSGSTGKPKGVKLSHRAFSTCLHHQAAVTGFDGNTRAFEFASYSFDVSWNNMFKALYVGGCLCVPSEDERKNDLAGAINRYSATHMDMTPSVARIIDPSQLKSLEFLILAGEKVDLGLFSHWKPKIKVMVAYGPSECTSIATFNPGSESGGIGRGVGCVTWIVDSENCRRLMPIGAAGELLIEGPLVGNGYYNNPSQTEAAYVSSLPWLEDSPQHHGDRRDSSTTLYKTGDLVRYDDMGNIHFVARKDAQAKLRGQRIELEEVEHHVLAAMGPGVIVSVYAKIINTTRGSEPGTSPGQMLVAFLACERHPSTGTEAEFTNPSQEAVSRLGQVNTTLQANLPTYMVPSAYYFITAPPWNRNGKTDRQALAAMAARASDMHVHRGSAITTTNGTHHKAYQAPTTDAEVQMQRLWATVLGKPIEDIGRADDFFLQHNGDSLAAMRLVSLARAKGRTSLRVSDVFKSPRLCDLAALMTDQSTPTEDPPSSNAIPPFMLLGSVPGGSSINVDAIRQEVANKCSNISPQDVEDVLLSTPLQESMLASTARYPDAFVSFRLYRIPEAVDLARLHEAWNTVVARNPILRTRFAHVGIHGLMQVVINETSDWKVYSSIKDCLDSSRRNPMTPGSRLTRWGVIRQGREVRLVWTIHHALYDGWSLPLVEAQLRYFYFQSPNPLPVCLDMKPFIKATLLDSETRDGSIAFWAQELARAAESSSVFPTIPTKVRELTQPPRADSYLERTIPLNPTPSLMGGASLTELVYAAWSILAGRLTSGSDDVLFGAILTGRDAPIDGIEHIVGPTITTVPIRVRLDPSKPISYLMNSLRARTVRTMPHQHLGMQTIKGINDSCAAACNFQTVLVVQPRQTGSEGEEKDEKEPLMEELDERLEGGYVFPNQVETFNQHALLLEVMPESKSITVRASFDGQIITPARMDRILARFEHLLIQLSSALSTAASEAELEPLVRDLSSASNRDLESIWKWNHDVPAAIRHKLVQDSISDLVERQPSALALDAWDGQMTYSELGHRSSALSEHLTQVHGVRSGHLIPLLFEKSMWTNVSMLAILKAGAAFVPLDVNHPHGRLMAMMQQLEASVSVVLCSTYNRDLAMRLAPGCRALTVDGASTASMMENGGSKETREGGPVVVTADDLAYVAYTSGSTGVPKGVRITHTNLASATHYQAAALGFGASTRALDSSSYAFDACIFNTFYTWTQGGCLCVPDDAARIGQLGVFMRDRRVTLAQLTPSVARALNPDGLPDLGSLLLTGEPMAVDDVERWGSRLRLVNLYGPTECTIMCSAALCITDVKQVGNIGRGLGANMWLTEVGDTSKLVCVGDVGEILIEGPLVGGGYMPDGKQGTKNWPAVVDPSWLAQGTNTYRGRRGNLYRTGDLARYDESGSFVYAGRIGSETKLRGQRVDLVDVEDNLRRQMPREVEVVVDVIELDLGSSSSGQEKRQMLVAFASLSVKPSSEVLHHRLRELAPDLSAHLDRVMPSHLKPEAFVPLSLGIPKTSSGKTHRRRLKEIGKQLLLDQLIWISGEDIVANAAKRHIDPPSTSEEKWLAGLWAQVLRIDAASISRQDNFFRLGGDSIGVMRLTTLCYDQGLPLHAKDVFQTPQLGHLARVIQETAIEKPEQLIDIPNDGVESYKPFMLIDTSEVPDISNFIQYHVEPILGISKANIEDILPANGFQMDCMNSKDEPLGLQYAFFDISQEIHWPRLVDACRAVVQASECLRGRFIRYSDNSNGRYHQVILKTAPLLFEEISIDTDRPGEKDWTLTSFMHRLCEADIASTKTSDALTKLTLISGDQLPRRRVVLRMSHAQSDGWCSESILLAIATAYNHCGSAPEATLPPTPPFSHVLYHRKQIVKASRDYWRNLLAGSKGPSPTVVLKPLAKNEKVRTFRTRTVPYFNSGLARPAIVLSAAWALVLADLLSARPDQDKGHLPEEENDSDIVFGSVSTGRNGEMAGMHDVVGPCVNMLPMRLRVPRQADGDEEAKMLRSIVQEAGAQIHGRYAFEGLDWNDMVEHCTNWPRAERYRSAVHFRNMNFRPVLSLNVGDGTNLEQMVVDWMEVPTTPNWTTILAFPEDEDLRVWVHADPAEISDAGADEILEKLVLNIVRIVRVLGEN